MKNSMLLCALLLTLAGCGGGGASVTQPTNTAVVFFVADTFNNMTTAATAIKGIQVVATLPPGVFPNVSSGRNLRIGETGLKNLKGTTSLQFGRYSATTNQVVFALVANDIATGNIGFGDFARLTYTTTASPAPVLADFQRQQLSYRVSGPNAVDLSGRVTPGVSLTTYLRPN